MLNLDYPSFNQDLLGGRQTKGDATKYPGYRYFQEEPPLTKWQHFKNGLLNLF